MELLRTTIYHDMMCRAKLTVFTPATIYCANIYISEDGSLHSFVFGDVRNFMRFTFMQICVNAWADEMLFDM